MSRDYSIIFYILLILFLASCTTVIRATDENPVTDNYTSAFPVIDVSKQLSDIQKSVVRISSTAIYVKYFFGDTLLTPDEINSANIEQLATQRISQNQSKAGTAIAIARNERWATLITNRHVVHFPDTVLSYVNETGLEAKKYIKSITLKRDQQNVILDLPTVGSLDVLATNVREDLALVEVNLNEFKDINVVPLKSIIGNSKKLKLASVIYVMGYPKGLPMVTRAIVSDPNRNEQGDFLTDALFNDGISGGIILASRDNYSSFEWVGMTKTSYAGKNLHLVPNPSKPDDYESMEIYRDNLFVERDIQINYGVTEAIPMQTILDFITKNYIYLLRRGLRIPPFQ